MSSVSGVAAGRAFVLIEAVDKTGRVLNQASRRLNQFAGQVQRIGIGMAAIGASFAIPFTSAIKASSELSDELLHIQIALDITSKSMEDVEKVVRRLGETTSFTAIEVAQAAAELARGGFSKKEVTDSLNSVLGLARVGRMELAPAAKVMIQSMRVFGIEAEEASRVADAFAIASKNGATNIEELAQAMSFSGGTAAELNMELEEVVATLAVVSKNMLTATKGGTSLNQFLTRLATRAEEVKKVLGIDVFDASGSPKDALAIINELTAAMEGLSDQERIQIGDKIFNVRGARQFLAIGRSGRDIENLVKKIREGVGQAQKDFDTLDSGIGGSIRRIISAFDGLRQSVGDAFEGPFREAEKVIIPFLNYLSDYAKANPQVFHNIAAGAAALATAGLTLATVGAGSIAALGAITSIVSSVAALAASGPAIGITAAAIGQLVLVVGYLGAAFTTAGAAAATVWEDIKHDVRILGTTLFASFKRISSALTDSLGGAFDEISDALNSNKDSYTEVFKEIIEAATEMIDDFTELAVEVIPSVVGGLRELAEVLADIAGYMATINKFKNLFSEAFGRTFESSGAGLLTGFAKGDSLGGIAREFASKRDKEEKKKSNKRRRNRSADELMEEFWARRDGVGEDPFSDEAMDEDRKEKLKQENLKKTREEISEKIKAYEEWAAEARLKDKELSLSREREDEARKGRLKEISKLEIEMARELDEEKREDLRRQLEDRKRTFEFDERQAAITKKRREFAAEKQAREIERRKKELAEMKKEAAERFGVDPGSFDDSSHRKDTSTPSRGLPIPLSLLGKLGLAGLAERRRSLESLQERVRNQANSSLVSTSLEKGSVAAAQTAVRIRSEQRREAHLKQIEKYMKMLTELERRVLSFFETSEGGGV